MKTKKRELWEIRPLVWRKNIIAHWLIAETMSGRIALMPEARGWWSVSYHSKWYRSLEDAKAAAEKWYRTQLKKALRRATP